MTGPFPPHGPFSADRNESALRKLFSLKAAGLLQGIEPLVQVGLDAVAGKYLDQLWPLGYVPWLTTGRWFGVAAQRPVYLIWNPAGSGYITVVEAGEVAVTIAAGATVEWWTGKGMAAVPAGAVKLSAIATDQRWPQPSGATQTIPGLEFHGNNLAVATSIPTWIAPTPPPGAAFDTDFQTLTAADNVRRNLLRTPVVLQPGAWLALDTLSVPAAAGAIATFRGYSRPAFSNELAVGV